MTTLYLATSHGGASHAASPLTMRSLTVASLCGLSNLPVELVDGTHEPETITDNEQPTCGTCRRLIPAVRSEADAAELTQEGDYRRQLIEGNTSTTANVAYELDTLRQVLARVGPGDEHDELARWVAWHLGIQDDMRWAPLPNIDGTHRGLWYELAGVRVELTLVADHN